MVAQAKARNAIAVKNGRVELLHDTVDDLPFAGDTFHKAMAINSMQIWPNAIAGLREMWRVLKSGGTIALGFTPYSGQRNQGLTEKLSAGGFVRPRVVLGATVAHFGPLLELVPIQPLRIAIGILLLLFGMRWLRKAILRAAGIIPLHDENRIFAME